MFALYNPELRQVTGNRVVELEAPLLMQHHDGGAGEELGIRKTAENDVPAHGNTGLAVLHAEGLEQRQLAVPGDQCDRSGEPALGDRGELRLAEALHAGEGEADGIRSDRDKRIRHDDRETAP